MHDSELTEVPAGLSLGDCMRSELRQQAAWLVFVAAALMIGFAVPLRDLFQFSLRSDFYSHIPLVPFISLYLVWLGRHRSGNGSRPARLLASSLLIMALALLGAYWINLLSGWKPGEADRLSLLTLDFLLFFWSGCAFVLGRRTLRALAFPLCLLVFMAPLPAFVEHAVEAALQHGSAEATWLLLKISGTPVFREGTVFQVPGFSFDVAPECSGLRSTLVLFITSLLAGHMFLRGPWAKTALAASVFALGILRNAFRIFTLAQLCIHVDPQIIHSSLHRRGGPLFFGLSLIPFFLTLWLLRRFENRQKHPPNRI